MPANRSDTGERYPVEAFETEAVGYLLKPVRFGEFSELMVTLNKYWTLVELP